MTTVLPQDPMVVAPAARVEAPFRRFVVDFCDSKLALAGLFVFVAVIIIALVAPLISQQIPYDLSQLDILDGRQPPGTMSAGGFVFWLGSDDQGRDMLSGIFYGLRISLAVGVISTVIALVVGAALGLLAAYSGGRPEGLLMPLVDIQLSFPAILVGPIPLPRLRHGSS